MFDSRSFNQFLACCSILFALVCQVSVLWGGTANWRPPFVLVVVIWWLSRYPYRYGLMFAWCSGLALDLAVGEMFGRYAIVYAICGQCLLLLQKRLHHFQLFHQLFLLILLVPFSQLLLFGLTFVLRPDWQNTLSLFNPTVSSLILWPLLCFVLDRLCWSRAQLASFSTER